jgi:tyrosyl-tRNA synthetase
VDERQHPGARLRAFGHESRRSPPDDEKRLLDGVLGQALVTQDAKGEPVGGSAEAVVELGEGFLVVAGNERDERLVGEVGQIRAHTRSPTGIAEPYRRADDGHSPRIRTTPRSGSGRGEWQNRLIERLTRNAVHVLPEGELERKLALGRPLRVKLGIDVTAPHVTLGNGIPLQRMRAFQDEGHIGVLIVGDYTTRIGDPSGRSETRPMLSGEEIDRNAQRYFDHATTIVDPERTELRFNSEWLGKLDFAEILRLTRTTTVARLLERDDFAKRFGTGVPISVSELLYPLMQAYDSVAVQADIELGGTDQLYNLLAGRDVMEAYGLDPQMALTNELILSWDGRAMSASRGNYIALVEEPEEQFGKTMRLPDELLSDYYRLVMESDEDPRKLDPLEAKLTLARFIVTRAHGEEEAARAEAHFTRVVREGQAPEEVAELVVPDGDPVHLPALLVEHLNVESTSEARRLIAQGGVKLDGDVVSDLDVPRERLDGRLLQAGKRRFVRLRAA